MIHWDEEWTGLRRDAGWNLLVPGTYSVKRIRRAGTFSRNVFRGDAG